jgi:hypothetical protein
VLAVDQSFCDKYAGILGVTQAQLVGTVVDGAVGKFLDASGPFNLRRFFDGSIPKTVNFTADTAKYTALRTHLIEFFELALGCTGAPAYSGVPLTVAHKNLPLARADWEKFNYAIIEVLRGAGVTPADQSAALSLLTSVKCDNTIAPGSSCNQEPACQCSTVSPATVAVASVGLIAAALFALF